MRHKMPNKRAEAEYKRAVIKAKTEFLAAEPRKPFGPRCKFMRGTANYRLNLTTVKDVEGDLIKYHFANDHPQDTQDCPTG